MRASVFVRVRVEGFHRWEGAPPEHAYLASRHRHLFHVELRVPVTHSDRDVEFIDLARRVRLYLVGVYGDPMELDGLSCEHLAAELLAAFTASEVHVSEDGENGAVVTC